MAVTTNLRGTSSVEVPAVTSSTNVGTGRREHTYKATVDFSVINVVVTDVIQLFDISAGQKITEVNFNVRTAEGGVSTFDLGDVANVDRFVDGGDLNTAGRLEAAASTEFFYVADGVVSLLAMATATTAVIDIWITVIDYV